jgi:anaerobic selenocysteine-containing dehydrogenase
MSEARTAYRTCPLCEATCGLELSIVGEEIVRVRGDRQHVFSEGFLCPKGAALNKLVHDPDRLRRPLVKRDGEWEEVGWDEAFEVVDAGLRTVAERHGPEAIGVYLGNPNAHTMAGHLYIGPLLRALRTHNRFSASTVDQMPKHVACGHMYGSPFLIPVPDIDHTDLLVLLGANPYESNGSLCTAPDFPGRLEALQARGGRFVVVDPRRTKTAVRADEHLAIRPSTDAFLLFAIVHTLFDEGLVDLGALDGHVVGVDEVALLAKDFPPEDVSDACGIPADRIRELARAIADAPTAAVYGRIGTCTVEFGTVTSWLVDVVNVLSGNLDRPGGVLFPLAAHQPRDGRTGKGWRTGRWASRVRGLPEVSGELPAATMAEEIDTPGDGQIRAMLTIGGNPVLSTPHSDRLDRALGALELMVSVDPYLNETTRHADVILPPDDSARIGHYDFGFYTLAVRNTATYSPPALPPDPGGLDECTILAKLTLIAMGAGPDADPAAVDEQLLVSTIERAVGDERSPVAGRDPVQLRALTEGDGPPERLLDVLVRVGAYGDGFGADPEGLTLQRLREAPHGIDLGPLQSRLPAVLLTPGGAVDLCPEPFAADVPRLRAALDDRPSGLVLVGRRHLRSNNSWMHNVHVLVKGKDRCTLQVHPEDAERLSLADGAKARIASRVGSLLATVEVTEEVMAGVVSLPHGGGHDAEGARLSVAAAHAGVNSNVLTDDLAIDPLSGNAVLNGIPVTVEAV